MNNTEFITEYISRGSVLIALICGIIYLGNFITIPAVLRHRIGMIGTVFVLLLPIPLLAGWQWAVMPAQSIEFIEPVKAENAPVSEELSVTAPMASSVPALSNTRSVNIPRLILMLWLSGSLAFLLYALTGFAVLHRLNRESLASDSRLKKMLDDLLRSQKIKTKVKLVASAQVNSPFTWGVVSPVIALPDTAKNWPTEKVRLVFLHELAHITRRDALSLMLNRLLVALNWFNPLAWFLSHQLENLREEVCDGVVLRKGVSPCDYAECLVQMASRTRSSRNFSLAVSETKTVETRIKMILNHTPKLTSPPRKFFSWASASLIATLALFITTLAFAENERNSALAAAQAKKLEKIIIPKIEFADTNVVEAVNFLVHRSRELDTISTKTGEKGVNVVLLGDFSNVNMTLKLSDVPVGTALKYVSGLAAGDFEKGKYTVVIRAKAISSSRKKSVVRSARLSGKADSKLGKKLDELILPSVQFKDTPLDQALNFIQDRSAELSGDNKGVNIIMMASEGKPTVTLNLRSVPIGTIIELTAEAAGYQAVLEEHAVIVKKGSP